MNPYCGGHGGMFGKLEAKCAMMAPNHSMSNDRHFNKMQQSPNEDGNSKNAPEQSAPSRK